MLVLDDLDLLRGPGARRARRAAGRTAGAALHVVAATRSDPHLPLERLRLSGGLGELRASDLAFTLPEATASCSAELGLDAAAGARRAPGRAHRRLGGGLRLAGLSLRGETDRDAFVADFAGDDRAVADYLTGEVLAGQTPATRELLLRASIAERVCGGLVDALTGGEGSALALEGLERAGTLVVPLDRHRTWFRFHGLFAELLRARLRLERPGLEPELHARAADVARGRRARARGDPARARGRRARRREPGRGALAAADARRPVAQGRDRRRRAGPRRPAARRVGGLGAAGARRRRPAPRRELAGVGDSDADAGRVRRRCCAPARPATWRGLARAADDAAARHRTGPRRGRAARAHPVPPGAAEFAHGRLELAAEQLEGAAAIAVEDGSRGWLLIECLGHSAALAFAEGALRRAETAARVRAGARRAARLAPGRRPAAWAYAALAAVHWHRDELDDAERRTDAGRGCRLRGAGASRTAVIAARALRAHLAAARGDIDARARADARRRASRCPKRGIAASAGSRRSARRSGRPAGPTTRWPRPPTGSTRGDPLAALRRVEALPEAPGLHPVLRLYAWLIAALAHHGLGRLDLASQRARAGAGARRRRGLPAPVRRSGCPVRRLLERHLARPTAYGPLVAELLDALAQGGDAQPGLLEPLSERERAVLRLLPALLSEPGDRERAVRLGQHRQDAHQDDLPQARCHQPARRGRASPRDAVDLSAPGAEDGPWSPASSALPSMTYRPPRSRYRVRWSAISATASGAPRSRSWTARSPHPMPTWSSGRCSRAASRSARSSGR